MLSRFDYFFGRYLGIKTAPFIAPEPDWIRMSYFTLRNLRFRQNNLHLVRPFRLGNRFLIEKMYEYRYQKEWHNIAKLCWELFGKQRSSWQYIGAFLRLHAARLVTRYGMAHFRPAQQFFLELPVVCDLMSQLLDTRFAIVNTPYGGCTLDIDNAEHYAAICANFTAWLSHQEALDREMEGDSYDAVSA